MSIFANANYCEAREVPALEPVLQRWIVANQAYARTCPGDNSWDYGERSCVGFLAAGVWLSGGIALEEWGTEKGPTDGRWNGRCDLWIQLRESYTACIEAKKETLLATDDKNYVRASIEMHLGRATIDASHHALVEDDQKLGVLFAAPVFAPDQQNAINDRIAAWLEGVYSVPHSAIAWTFQDSSKVGPSETEIYPGVVLIARTHKKHVELFR
jgi:hypothetical protein